MTIQGIHVSGYKLSKQQNSFKKMVDLFFQNKSFYNMYFFFSGNPCESADLFR